MENWIRCNKCYQAMKDSRKDFVLTQCRHVFCDRCFVPNQCLICRTSGVRNVKIEMPLQPFLTKFFQSVSEQLDTADQAMELQRVQASMLCRRFEETESRSNKLKKIISKHEDWKSQAEFKNEELKKDIERMTEVLGKRREIEKKQYSKKASRPVAMKFQDDFLRHQEEKNRSFVSSSSYFRSNLCSGTSTSTSLPFLVANKGSLKHASDLNIKKGLQGSQIDEDE